MIIRRILITLITAFAVMNCSATKESERQISEDAARGKYAEDPHSFARPWEAVVTHLSLDLTVNFDEKILHGRASLSIEVMPGVRQLHLDGGDLIIERVTLGEDEIPAEFTLGEDIELLGRPLIIEIQSQTEAVNIYYATIPQSGALDWVAPAHTIGGKHPFLYTQSQPIFARRWIPLQDTPAVRFTYEARVTVPPELMAVMSAANPTRKNPEGVYEFVMPQAIPSYLMAMGVGNLEFREMGRRTGIYAEPELIEAAAYEFADTEKMMLKGEEMYGPYRWERYDLLVLPPSFPWGGMENPRLTFLTPTVIVGDRSLVSLIAHELAHSWSGNLVTNASWDDIWLNEGFTTYLEGRIMEEVFGSEYEQMLSVLDRGDLLKEIKELGVESPDTHLKINLKGRDPDDGFTDIPYLKGKFFLITIERVVGREKWDAFLKTYFEKYAFKSITTEGFMDYLNANLLSSDKSIADSVNASAWVYSPGIPGNFPLVRSGELESVNRSASMWSEGGMAADVNTDGWTTHHWLKFLRSLPRENEISRMKDLDSTFGLTKSGNPEILVEWLVISITSRYEPAYPVLENFLLTVGRRKLLKPLYTKMAETPEGLATAQEIYERARLKYHHSTKLTIAKILGLEEMQ
ncbi:MAG: M1 family metallopeptidase [Candidatus Marinimicrobia bacterium]|nr:M1 family metallopeptidase [Candidatus Neomarinimicrobiota bacterium]